MLVCEAADAGELEDVVACDSTGVDERVDEGRMEPAVSVGSATVYLARRLDLSSEGTIQPGLLDITKVRNDMPGWCLINGWPTQSDYEVMIDSWIEARRCKPRVLADILYSSWQE